MTTLGDVITEVRSLLRSHTGQHERTTYLTADVNSSALTLSVADGSVVDQGLIEIDDELLYVESSAGGAVTLPPFGRGYSGSVGAAHVTGAQVIVDPFFPKQSIRKQIDHTLAAVFPKLYAVDTVDLVYAAGQTSYELPTDSLRVISASWQLPGATGMWVPLKRWRIDTVASTSAFASGKALHTTDLIVTGATLRVLVAKDFTPFVDSSSTLADAGLEESAADVLVYGAAWRLLQFLEVSRQNLDSVQNQERAKYASSGSASALTRQVLGLYERRLEEERDKLRQLYPMSIRFTR